MQPHVPPLQSAELEPIGGHLGREPEHFVVEEVPAYLPSGEGDHLYVFVEKRLLTTPELINAVARAAGVPAREIGSAGMKDKHGVTRQWLSLPKSARPPAEWEIEGVRVLESSLHRNKLRTGHLRGNRFSITVVDVVEDALDRAQAITELLRRDGLRNYFGSQRFGNEGRNLIQALEWAQSSDAGESSEKGERTNQRRGRRRPSRFQNKLFPSVLQSEIFNRYVTARLERSEELLKGEVVRLEGSSKVFVVDDPERELRRLHEGDIHRTGPMIGPKTVAAEGPAGELERDAALSLELSDEQLAVLTRHAPGTRRDLLLRPEGLEIRSQAPGTLVISFGLPSGSYATQLIREFTHDDWLAPRGPRTRPEG